MAKDDNRQLSSMLSLCKRSGSMVSGEVGVEQAIKNKTALLVIIAEDASENTKTKFLNKTKFYNVKVVVYGKKEFLGNCIGQYNRTVLAVTENENFALRISQLIENSRS